MKFREFWAHKAVHVTVILIVFSCTGLTVARLGAWLADWAGLEKYGLLWWLMWIVALLPLYNVLLIMYATIFGKYRFFREKQKKMWRRMTGWMRK